MSNQVVTVNTDQERDQWSLMKDQSEILLKSGALPRALTNLPQVMAVVQYGRELGYMPMTALQNISLIQGKPTLSANLIGARLKNAGYDFWPTEYTDTRVAIMFKSPNGREVEFDYSMDEAEKAGNVAKDNYRKYSKEMLYARCLTRGGRVVAPEVLAGVYSPEEFDSQQETDTHSKVDFSIAPAAPIEPKDRIQEAKTKLLAAQNLNDLKDIAEQYSDVISDPELHKLGADKKAEIVTAAESIATKQEDILEGEIVKSEESTREKLEKLQKKNKEDEPAKDKAEAR